MSSRVRDIWPDIHRNKSENTGKQGFSRILFKEILLCVEL
jgi:hypothetical protein